MKYQPWREEPRKNYSDDFKLRMVGLVYQPGVFVIQITHGVVAALLNASDLNESSCNRLPFR